MDLLDFIDKFCEPVVSDDVLCDPQLEVSIYKDLMIERNAVSLCGWAKCGKRIETRPGDEDQVIFCSHECQFNSQQFVASLVPTPPGPIGKVIEKFADQKPPKPRRTFIPDAIDGFRVRVGPYRQALEEIEKWFGGFSVTAFGGLSPQQTEIFDCVNGCLSETKAALEKRDPDVVAFFANIDTTNPKVLTEGPKPLKMAFAIVVHEYLTSMDAKKNLAELDIPVGLYTDLLRVVNQTDDTGFGF